MPYDRLTDQHCSADELKVIQKERKQQNKIDHKLGIVPANTCRAQIKTPLGTKQRMLALREELLKDDNTKNVLAKVISMALDDEHPGQVAALKMCCDRMMPVSMFEEKAGGQRTSITISITGVGDAKIVGDTIEGEVL